MLDDVKACERYYRDHCLHGLAGGDPAPSQVSDCVKVIEAAGQCAADNDKDVELAACDPAVTDPQPPDLTTACQVVEHPEFVPECEFLLPVAPEPDGEGGTGNEPEPEPEGEAGQAAGGTSAE